MPRPKQQRDVTRARQLRSTMSLPEVLLWQLLRKNPQGVKFRRQHPIGTYILDFYCAQARIGIEIDGAAHDMSDRAVRDEARDAWLEAQGITVVRVPAAEVLRSPERVAEALVLRCKG